MEQEYKGIKFNVAVMKSTKEKNKWTAKVEFIISNGSQVTIKPYSFPEETRNSENSAIQSAIAWARKHIDDGMPE